MRHNTMPGYQDTFRTLDISVEYTYGFPHGKEAVIVLRCSNNEEAVKALENKNIELLSAKDFKDF